MAYINLLYFLKKYHGLGDIGSVPRPMFQEKTGKICKDVLNNEEEMPQGN